MKMETKIKYVYSYIYKLIVKTINFKSDIMNAQPVFWGFLIMILSSVFVALLKDFALEIYLFMPHQFDFLIFGF